MQSIQPKTARGLVIPVRLLSSSTPECEIVCRCCQKPSGAPLNECNESNCPSTRHLVKGMGRCSFSNLTKAKDDKAKDGKAKDDKAKDGKAKDDKAKDGKAKDGKAINEPKRRVYVRRTSTESDFNGDTAVSIAVAATAASLEGKRLCRSSCSGRCKSMNNQRTMDNNGSEASSDASDQASLEFECMSQGVSMTGVPPIPAPAAAAAKITCGPVKGVASAVKVATGTSTVCSTTALNVQKGDTKSQRRSVSTAPETKLGTDVSTVSSSTTSGDTKSPSCAVTEPHKSRSHTHGHSACVNAPKVYLYEHKDQNTRLSTRQYQEQQHQQWQQNQENQEQYKQWQQYQVQHQQWQLQQQQYQELLRQQQQQCQSPYTSTSLTCLDQPCVLQQQAWTQYPEQQHQPDRVCPDPMVTLIRLLQQQNQSTQLRELLTWKKQQFGKEEEQQQRQQHRQDQCQPRRKNRRRKHRKSEEELLGAWPPTHLVRDYCTAYAGTYCDRRTAAQRELTDVNSSWPGWPPQSLPWPGCRVQLTMRAGEATCQEMNRLRRACEAEPCVCGHSGPDGSCNNLNANNSSSVRRRASPAPRSIRSMYNWTHRLSGHSLREQLRRALRPAEASDTNCSSSVLGERRRRRDSVSRLFDSTGGCDGLYSLTERLRQLRDEDVAASGHRRGGGSSKPECVLCRRERSFVYDRSVSRSSRAARRALMQREAELAGVIQSNSCSITSSSSSSSGSGSGSCGRLSVQELSLMSSNALQQPPSHEEQLQQQREFHQAPPAQSFSSFSGPDKNLAELQQHPQDADEFFRGSSSARSTSSPPTMVLELSSIPVESGSPRDDGQDRGQRSTSSSSNLTELEISPISASSQHRRSLPGRRRSSQPKPGDLAAMGQDEVAKTDFTDGQVRQAAEFEWSARPPPNRRQAPMLPRPAAPACKPTAALPRAAFVQLGSIREAFVLGGGGSASSSLVELEDKLRRVVRSNCVVWRPTEGQPSVRAMNEDGFVRGGSRGRCRVIDPGGFTVRGSSRGLGSRVRDGVGGRGSEDAVGISFGVGGEYRDISGRVSGVCAGATGGVGDFCGVGARFSGARDAGGAGGGVGLDFRGVNGRVSGICGGVTSGVGSDFRGVGGGARVECRGFSSRVSGIGGFGGGVSGEFRGVSGRVSGGSVSIGVDSRDVRGRVRSAGGLDLGGRDDGAVGGDNRVRIGGTTSIALLRGSGGGLDRGVGGASGSSGSHHHWRQLQHQASTPTSGNAALRFDRPAASGKSPDSPPLKPSNVEDRPECRRRQTAADGTADGLSDTLRDEAEPSALPPAKPISRGSRRSVVDSDGGVKGSGSGVAAEAGAVYGPRGKTTIQVLSFYNPNKNQAFKPRAPLKIRPPAFISQQEQRDAMYSKETGLVKVVMCRGNYSNAARLIESRRARRPTITQTSESSEEAAVRAPQRSRQPLILCH